MPKFDFIEKELEKRKDLKLYRQRAAISTGQKPNLVIDGKAYLAFSSNDYLGLACHPKLVSTFQKAAEQYGVGSGASHLVTGHSQAHHELEEALAAYVGRPRALLFSTGYMANIGAVNALLKRQDAVFEDRLNHASLLDAGLFSSAAFNRYPHNDVNHLSSLLEKSSGENKLIVTDSVFSMDGDIAPLDELIQAAKSHDAWLMVDDAHGFGVLGDKGQGCLGLANQSSYGVDDVQVYMGTLGKAMGTSGAFIAGSESLIELLIQKARSYIYTTAMPPAVAAATLVSLELSERESWRRDKLISLVQRFQAGMKALPYELMPSLTPIQPILVGSAEKALALSQFLKERHIWVNAIRPPTVPMGAARLRVTLTAAHTEEQVDHLLTVLADFPGTEAT